VCVEVTNYYRGCLVVGFMVKEVVKTVSVHRHSMVCVDNTYNYLIVFFNINNDQVGIGKQVVKDVVNDV